MNGDTCVATSDGSVRMRVEIWYHTEHRCDGPSAQSHVGIHTRTPLSGMYTTELIDQRLTMSVFF